MRPWSGLIPIFDGIGIRKFARPSMIPIMVPAETQKSRGGVYGTEKEEMRGNRGIFGLHPASHLRYHFRV